MKYWRDYRPYPWERGAKASSTESSIVGLEKYATVSLGSLWIWMMVLYTKFRDLRLTLDDALCPQTR
jgi:hypothetical protein